MMTYDETIDLSLEMLLTLSIKRDTECKKIKGYSDWVKKIEIRDKISNKKHRRPFRNDCSTNKHSLKKQSTLETKLNLKDRNIKKIVKRNKKIMVSKIVRLSKKISRHSEIVKERIQIRKEIFHESIYADNNAE